MEDFNVEKRHPAPTKLARDDYPELPVELIRAGKTIIDLGAIVAVGAPSGGSYPVFLVSGNCLIVAETERRYEELIRAWVRRY